MTYDKNIPLPQYLSSSATGNFFLLAGPCVIEGEKMALEIAEKAVELTSRLDIPYVSREAIARRTGRASIPSPASVTWRR